MAQILFTCAVVDIAVWEEEEAGSRVQRKCTALLRRWRLISSQARRSQHKHKMREVLAPRALDLEAPSICITGNKAPQTSDNDHWRLNLPREYNLAAGFDRHILTQISIANKYLAHLILWNTDLQVEGYVLPSYEPFELQ